MVEPTALQRYSLFGGLLEEQIAQILPLMEQKKFNNGDNIIIEGQPNGSIWFIIEGRVAVIKGGIVFSEFKEGDAFGEMEVLEVMPSAATIKAQSDVTVMSLSNKSLREVYKIDIKTFSLIIMNLARDLSRRLRHMDEKAVGLA
jgi:CRP-like cAMP-binding protein